MNTQTSMLALATAARALAVAAQHLADGTCDPSDDVTTFVVDLYSDDGGADCLPQFYATREAAEAAGRAEVARVAAIPPGALREPFDFATRFEVRECPPLPGETGAGQVLPRWPIMALEFPDFDQATLPTIPNGWEDTSWHNDQCPGFVTPEGCTVYVGYVGRLGDESDTRYSVRVMEMPDPEGGWQMPGTNTFPDLDSDDWGAVLAHVAKVPAMRRAFEAVPYFEALHAAISGLNRLYDATGEAFNAIQPEAHIAAVCPMSFDEWALEAGALVRAWEALAVGDEPEPTQSPFVGVLKGRRA
jgi:hypothetical protein